MPDTGLGILDTFIIFNPATLGLTSLATFYGQRNRLRETGACPVSPSLENAECLTECSSSSYHAAHGGP